jgi:hypothetical protein
MIKNLPKIYKAIEHHDPTKCEINGDYVKLPYIDLELKQKVALGKSLQFTKGFLYKRHYCQFFHP